MFFFFLEILLFCESFRELDHRSLCCLNSFKDWKIKKKKKTFIKKPSEEPSEAHLHDASYSHPHTSPHLPFKPHIFQFECLTNDGEQSIARLKSPRSHSSTSSASQMDDFGYVRAMTQHQSSRQLITRLLNGAQWRCHFESDLNVSIAAHWRFLMVRARN